MWNPNSNFYWSFTLDKKIVAFLTFLVGFAGGEYFDFNNLEASYTNNEPWTNKGKHTRVSYPSSLLDSTCYSDWQPAISCTEPVTDASTWWNVNDFQPYRYLEGFVTYYRFSGKLIIEFSLISNMSKIIFLAEKLTNFTLLRKILHS